MKWLNFEYFIHLFSESYKSFVSSTLGEIKTKRKTWNQERSSSPGQKQKKSPLELHFRMTAALLCSRMLQILWESENSGLKEKYFHFPTCLKYLKWDFCCNNIKWSFKMSVLLFNISTNQINKWIYLYIIPFLPKVYIYFMFYTPKKIHIICIYQL